MTDDSSLERLAGEHRAYRWAAALRTAGWLAIVVYAFQILAQFRRAWAITSSSFPDGVWGQRLETVSFVAFPANLIAFVVAAAAAVAASYVLPWAADRAELGIDRLLRVVDLVAYLVIAASIGGLIDVFWQGFDPVDGLNALANRGGGMLLAIAAIRLVREAERPA